MRFSNMPSPPNMPSAWCVHTLRCYPLLGPDAAVGAFKKTEGHRAGMFSLRMQIMDEEKDKNLPWLKPEMDKLIAKWEKAGREEGKPQPTVNIAYFKHY